MRRYNNAFSNFKLVSYVLNHNFSHPVYDLDIFIESRNFFRSLLFTERRNRNYSGGFFKNYLTYHVISFG